MVLLAVNIEKHNQEHHEKETNLHNGTAAGQNENSQMVFNFSFKTSIIMNGSVMQRVEARWCSGWRVGLSIGRSEDLRVVGSRPGWSLHCCVVSLDKKLCSTLSLFTQVYKWVPATYCWG